MSLRWDITNVADWEDLTGDDEAIVTQAIAMQAMSIGLGKITEANVEEFATRILVVESTFGPILRNGDEPMPLTFEQIRRRIGMTVNVADISKAQFNRRVATHLREQAVRELDRQRATV